MSSVITDQYAGKTLLGTYPKFVSKLVVPNKRGEDHHLFNGHQSQIIGKQRVMHLLTNVLPNKLGVMSFELDHVSTQIQFVNKNDGSVSPVQKICIPFKTPEWFETLCSNLGANDVYIITEDGPISISEVSREIIGFAGRIYADYDFKSNESPTIPEYYKENKTSRINLVLKNMIDNANKKLLERLKTIGDAVTFWNFIKHDFEIFYFKMIKTFTKTPGVYMDGETTDIEEYLQNYVNAKDVKVSKTNFKIYIQSRICRPLQTLFYFLEPRLKRYVQEIYAKKHENVQGVMKLSLLEHVRFWETVLNEFTASFFHLFDVQEFIGVLRRETIIPPASISERNGFTQRIIREMALKYSGTYQMPNTIKDPYADIMKGVHLPTYLAYEYQGMSYHPDYIKGDFAEHLPLLKHHSKKTKAHLDTNTWKEIEAAKNQQEERPKPSNIIFVRKPSTNEHDKSRIKILVVDDDSGVHDYKPETFISEETGKPIIHFKHKSDKTHDLMVSPIDGRWSVFEPLNNKFVAQNTLLQEILDKSGRYLVEQ